MSNFKSFQVVSCVVVFFFLSFSTQAQILVAVEDGSANGTGADIVSQLNDDTWVDFTATKVSAGDIDTPAELAAYDVVILGDSGNRNHDWTAAMSTALKDWVSAGGSAVLVGWGNYGMNASNAIFDPLDEIFPTQNIASTNDFDSSGAVMNILQPTHPIFTGLSDFSFPNGCCTEVNPLSLETGDVELARMNGSNDTGTVVAIKPAGNGKTVYLGPVYMGNTGYYVNDGLRTGDPDRLLEQAVAWAANGVIGPATYKVGGSVTGLTGTGLELQNNGADTLTVTADGAFTFGTELVDGAAYTVTVSTQPTGQICTVSNDSGTIATADVADVVVDCVAPPPRQPAIPVPTMSQWALILFAALLGLMVFVNRRRLF